MGMGYMISSIEFMELTFKNKQNAILRCLHSYSQNKDHEDMGFLLYLKCNLP